MAMAALAMADELNNLFARGLDRTVMPAVQFQKSQEKKGGGGSCKDIASIDPNHSERGAHEGHTRGTRGAHEGHTEGGQTSSMCKYAE